MKWFDLKFTKEEDAKEAHLLVGRLPYGPDGFYVKASPKLGDPVLWTHLMSVGGTFSGTDYIVVKAKTQEELVEKVAAISEDKCLHGTPFFQKEVWCQVLVACDPNVSKARRRQMFGCLLAFKYKDYEEVEDPVEEAKAEAKDDEEAKDEAEAETKAKDEADEKEIDLT